MNLFHFILFMLMSLMATLPVVFGRRSNSIELQNRLALFQGILGPIGLTLGLFYLWNSAGMQGWAGTAIYATEVLIGFLLTYGLLARFVAYRGQPDKANKVRLQLAEYQGPLGILGLALGAMWLSQGV